MYSLSGIFLLQPLKFLYGLQGIGLVPVDGGALAIVTLAFPVDAIGHGLVGGMEFFEFPVSLEGFIVLLFIEIGVRHLELGQESLLAIGVAVPHFFEGLDGIVIVLLSSNP